MITPTPHDPASSDSSDDAPVLAARRTRVARAAAVLRELWAGLRRFHAEQIELHERLLLLDQPRREDVRRCSDTDGEDQLDGRFTPPVDRWRPSVAAPTDARSSGPTLPGTALSSVSTPTVRCP